MFCPKLSFNKSKQLFCISYDYLDYGTQHFFFDGNVFINLYRKDKKTLTSNLVLYYPKMNKTVKDIFSNYLINPTLLNSCYNHKGKFSVELKSKTTIKKPRGVHSAKIRLKKAPNNEELDRCSKNMNIAVQKAKNAQDLNFFFLFLDAYTDYQIELGSVAPNYKPSKKFQDKAFDVFLKAVNN